MNLPQPMAALTSCPACAAPNPTAARFCGSCRAPLKGTPFPPPPPAPPPTAQGTAGQSTIGADLQTAFQLVLQGVQAAGGRVVTQSPPYSIRVSISRSGSRFEGDLTLTPVAAAQTVARLTLKPSGAALAFVVLITFIGLMSGAALPLAGLVSIGAGAWGLYHLLVEAPRQQATAILTRIPTQANIHVPQRPAVMHQPLNGGHPAPPAPAKAAPPPPAGQRENIVQTLNRLADLKAMGALTAEEFESKKAELIARLG